MSYTISYTDVANKGTIVIEDGTINTETSIGIPGRNTTAYGAVIAESFLHLLENFANSTEPNNPSEGQLWYDNTLGTETLKVYDGTNWVPASGIIKQINTPAIAQIGDLWVDTDNQQLYLFTGGGWILVGPSFSEGLSTGATPAQILGSDNISYTVLQIEVGSEVVAIISNNTPFNPKATIAGFATINPGVNLINKDTNNDGQSNFKFYGTAEKAENLIVANESIPAANFLRNDSTSTTSFPLNVQNNQGLSVGINSELTIGVEGNAGIIQQNIGGANIDVRVRNNDVTRTLMRLDSALRVGINNEAPEKELDVIGDIQNSGSLLVNGTTESTVFNNGSVIIKGGAGIAKNLNVGGNSRISGTLTTAQISPDDNNVRDIGSPAFKYRNIYATTFTGNVVGNVSGTITGRSTSSDRLTSRTTFAIRGDVESVVDVVFDGQFQDPTFNNGPNATVGELPLRKVLRTEISNTFIADKTAITESNSRDELIINSVAGDIGLKKITRENLLKSVPVNPPGVLMPYAGDAAPVGWLLCDGKEYEQESFKELFAVLGFKFGSRSSVTPGFFKIPDLRGRLPLGADNMGGASANIIAAESADNIGTFDGTETKSITLANLPEHKHDLRDSTRQQFYAIADVVGTPTDDNVQIYDAPTGTGLGQALSNSGGVITNVGLGAPLNIMPPTITLNYIIYTGRA
jgi:microcystin-dependent protein